MHEARNAGLSRPREQVERRRRIYVMVLARRMNRMTNTQTREVIHDGDLAQRVGHRRRVADVGHAQLATRTEVRHVLAPPVHQVVDHDDIGAARHQLPDELRPDETGAAGDERAARRRHVRTPAVVARRTAEATISIWSSVISG